MKKSLLLIFLSFFLLSCEDKKKVPDVKEILVEEKTISKEIISEINTISNTEETKQTHIFLTNENIEEFLLQYGIENPEKKVALNTSLGTIELELYTDTPLHRANFIYMLKNGYWDTTFFHRVLENFIIQGGNSDRQETSKLRNKLGKYTIPAEIKYKHHRGALASAKEYRENPDDRSSPFEFYIVQAPNGANHLNPNYTVFGKVTSGMDVVNKIAKLETDASEWPLLNVFMEVKILD
ncbi:MAG: peptidylprolyl isomerase [Bacteroidetes bacterium HGW-Bacteroidetes-2]|jgi:peptidylprolyl isomerase|nr:MAG: peptidylprolyl isomerase [Bacteroidetes bacterium HGW-Bacteroidetes-2]